MQIKNLSKSTLTLPTGEVIKTGEVADVEKLDEKHHVIAAWLEAGLIEKSNAKVKADDAETDKPQTKTTAKE